MILTDVLINSILIIEIDIDISIKVLSVQDHPLELLIEMRNLRRLFVTSHPTHYILYNLIIHPSQSQLAIAIKIEIARSTIIELTPIFESALVLLNHNQNIIHP